MHPRNSMHGAAWVKGVVRKTGNPSLLHADRTPISLATCSSPGGSKRVRRGSISTGLIALELGLELVVGIVYFAAFVRGLEFLLLLAIVHFATCAVRGLIHIIHQEQRGSGAAPPSFAPKANES